MRSSALPFQIKERECRRGRRGWGRGGSWRSWLEPQKWAHEIEWFWRRASKAEVKQPDLDPTGKLLMMPRWTGDKGFSGLFSTVLACVAALWGWGDWGGGGALGRAVTQSIPIGSNNEESLPTNHGVCSTVDGKNRKWGSARAGQPTSQITPWFWVFFFCVCVSTLFPGSFRVRWRGSNCSWKRGCFCDSQISGTFFVKAGHVHRLGRCRSVGRNPGGLFSSPCRRPDRSVLGGIQLPLTQTPETCRLHFRPASPSCRHRLCPRTGTFWSSPPRGLRALGRRCADGFSGSGAIQGTGEEQCQIWLEWTLHKNWWPQSKWTQLGCSSVVPVPHTSAQFPKTKDRERTNENNNTKQ